MSAAVNSVDRVSFLMRLCLRPTLRYWSPNVEKSRNMSSLMNACILHCVADVTSDGSIGLNLHCLAC